MKTAVPKAPADALDTTDGISSILGGAGGKGLVHNNTTNKNTYIEMPSGSVGAQIGASESDVLFIFKNDAAMNEFVNSGWTAGGGATAAAGAGGKSAGGGVGGNTMDTVDSYTLTKNGLQAGVAIAGSKYWKDKDLN
jgi:lipid-binding SYLF domain-containing protein